MRNRMVITSVLVAGLYVLVGSGLLLAQQPPPPGQGQAQGQGPAAGPGRDRGRFDPAQMREHMMEHIKEQLQASDKEWEVLKVAVDEVLKASRDVGGFGGRGMFFGRRGGRPEGGGGEAAPLPETEVEKAAQDLRTLLENKAAPPEEIKAKVQALRDARAKAKKDLDDSKSALRELITPWQEAQLVLMGILD